MKYRPPLEKEMRRATKCECGDPKLPGLPTCDICWHAAPEFIRDLMDRGNPRSVRRRATVRLLHFAHRRKGFGL